MVLFLLMPKENHCLIIIWENSDLSDDNIECEKDTEVSFFITYNE